MKKPAAEEIARVKAENLESFRRAGVPEKGPWTKAQTRRVNEVLREMRKERARGKAAIKASQKEKKKPRPRFQKWSGYRGDGPPLHLLSDETLYGLYTNPEERVKGRVTPNWEKAVAKARFEDTGGKPGEGLSMKEKEKFIKARKKK